MSPFAGNIWPPNTSPSPELLAAYADGEFEGRDELASLRRRVEDWLGAHPDAQAELSELRDLKKVFQDTSPPEPSAAAWDKVLAHLHTLPKPQVKRSRRYGWILAGCAAAAAVLLAVLLRGSPTRDEAIEELLVAAENEVLIVRVEGADTSTLVVGELPVTGTLELAAPGEIKLTILRPDPNDNMVPSVPTDANATPIIWSKLNENEWPSD